ncbi:MAG: hypothetical protein P4L31_01120 [Candidatus Babeliales bacterium]|nr:hypothetical protein [Candidatus Babeliales bacterium]
MGKRKSLCSWFDEIDSFNMFKYKEGLEWVKNSSDRICFEIFRYKLKARLMDDYSLQVSCDAGHYTISVEKKPCNFGGSYYFFHCPACKTRMRKLYCINGVYLCRKCANLGYHSQRLNPSLRCLYMGSKVKEFLKNRAGALDRKPPWQKQHTFQKLRKKYLDYDERHFYAGYNALRNKYGPIIDTMTDNHYCLFVPTGFYELYDYRDK